MLIRGDFNKASAPTLHSLKPIVRTPTRGDASLDYYSLNLTVYKGNCVDILLQISDGDHSVVFVKV